VKAAMDKFIGAEAGMANAKAALGYAEAKVPQVDMMHVYAVGHSSAAVVALQLAALEPRIAGCVAFAPACQIGDRLADGKAMLEKLRPGSWDYVVSLSPDHLASKITCPTLLFSAKDDTNVSNAEVVRFSETLKKTNKSVTMMSVARGGHYDSMIREGIPAAIKWLKQQASP